MARESEHNLKTILLEKREDAFCLKIEESGDGMELLASIDSIKKGKVISLKELKHTLAELQITAELDDSAMADFCYKAGIGIAQKEVVLAKGVMPVDGSDAKLEFLIQTKPGKPSASLKKDSQVDHHQLFLFENITVNQKIAIINPCGSGKSGLTVTGKVIPATTGKPIDDFFRFGKNLHLEKDELYSKIAGRVIIDENKKIVDVSDEFIVEGCVGPKTGDIDFIGSVEVKKDVLKSFNIKAGRNIVIHGNVEACSLTAVGDISVKGGIIGQGSGLVKCGGELTARYLDRVKVESRGGVLIKNEILNSSVKSDGKIQVTTGSIVGGSLSALTGIEAMELGSDIGVKTVLCAGKSFLAGRRLAQIADELEESDEKISMLSRKLKPFLSNPQLTISLPEAKRNSLNKLAARLRGLITRQEELNEKREHIKHSEIEKSNRLVSAKSKMHHGIKILIGDILEYLPSGIARPTTAVKNLRHGNISFVNYRPITFSSKELEKHVLKKELEKEAKAKAEKDKPSSQ